MKKRYFIQFVFCLFIAVLSGYSGYSEENSSSVVSQYGRQEEEIKAQVRESLMPPIQAALEKHCGEDCPSFQIEMHFKKLGDLDLVEDLGFGHVLSVPRKPELQSITLSVLTHQSVTEASRGSLKQILTQIVGNKTTVSFQIQIKTLNSLSPFLEKQKTPADLPSVQEDHRWELFYAVIWPVSLFLISLVGVLAVLLISKAQMQLLQARLNAKNANHPVPFAPSAENLEDHFKETDRILRTRKEDLQFLIEESAFERNLDLLKSVMHLFPSQVISTTLELSHSTLKILSELNANAKSEDSMMRFQEILVSFKLALDRAHWKRIEEVQFPLSKLRRFSDAQKIQFFKSLSTFQQKSASLLALSEDQWPTLMSELSPTERVAVGVAMVHYQNAEIQERIRLDAEVTAQIQKWMKEVAGSIQRQTESYSLYLEDTEAQALNQEIE